MFIILFLRGNYGHIVFQMYWNRSNLVFLLKLYSKSFEIIKITQFL